MSRVDDIWARDGGRCVWCSVAAWDRDRTVEHLLPRSRAGRDAPHNLLPACRACNRARRSQSAVAYARRRTGDGADVRVGLLLRGLERIAAEGGPTERRWALREGRAVRDWQASEAALAAHATRIG
jgi:HNH endonuclease